MPDPRKTQGIHRAARAAPSTLPRPRRNRMRSFRRRGREAAPRLQAWQTEVQAIGVYAIAERSSSGDTLVGPNLLTVTPAAALASVAASAMSPPAARTSARVAITVSPAPV